MRRLPALLLALVLGALSAFALACGEEREGLISADRASDLQERLDRVDEYTASGRCDALDENLAALRREVNDLPGSVDRDLRVRLREGVERLESQSPEECRGTTTAPETTPETVPTETIPPETVPTETAPPETTPPETTPPETTPPETTPPETTPAPETPPETPPGQSGGEEAPQGNVIGGGAG